jgi:hypothetical protein
MKKLDRTLAVDPRSPGSLKSPVNDTVGAPYFPHFHYEGPEELPIPPEGKMLVEYCQTRTEKSTTDGKEWYRCTVEVKRILGVEKAVEPPTEKNSTTEDALDALMKERSEAEEGGEDEEGEE